MSGKILDKVQYDFILNMRSDDDKKLYNVYELLMGRGKTLVIIPCTIFCYMLDQKYQNIMDLIPPHLVTQSQGIMNKLSPFFIDGFTVRSKSDRGTDHVNELNTVISLETHKVIIIDDQSIKSFMLSNVEKKSLFLNENKNIKGGKYLSIDTDNHEVDMIVKKILSKTVGKNQDKSFKENTLILMDEFDSLIDPMKSDLNYPHGNQKNIDNQILLNDMIVGITEILFTDYKNMILYSDRTDQKINKLVIKSVMNQLDANKYLIIKKLRDNFFKKVKTHNIEQFKSLDNSEKNILTNLQKGGSVDSMLMFFIRETYNQYTMCLGMMLDKDYGWDELNEQNPYTVIPYIAQKTPLSGSQFSDPMITIALTSISLFFKTIQTDRCYQIYRIY